MVAYGSTAGCLNINGRRWVRFAGRCLGFIHMEAVPLNCMLFGKWALRCERTSPAFLLLLSLDALVGGMGACPQWLHCLLFAAGSSHQTAHLKSLFFSPPMPKEHLASRTWRCLALKVSILSREECYPRVRAPGTAGGSPRCAWLSGEPGTWAGCSGTLVGSGAPTERLFLPLTCLVGMPSSVYLIPSAIMTEQRGFS